MELNRTNGEAFVPVRTTCDGPLVDSEVLAKIEGNLNQIAYDSYAQKNKKFLEGRAVGKADEEMEELQEADQTIAEDEERGENQQKVGKSYSLTD